MENFPGQWRAAQLIADIHTDHNRLEAADAASALSHQLRYGHDTQLHTLPEINAA